VQSLVHLVGDTGFEPYSPGCRFHALRQIYSLTCKYTQIPPVASPTDVRSTKRGIARHRTTREVDMAAVKGHRAFGHVRKLPSKRYQASYLVDGVRYKAAETFEDKEGADMWLAERRREIRGDEWIAPSKGAPLTFGTYAKGWLEHRQLKPRTRYHYEKMLDSRIFPRFKNVPIRAISAEMIDHWYAAQGDERPTARSHAYGLLRAILAGAVQDQKIKYNPCHIRGAGNSKRVHKAEPASLTELETIVAAMPDRYQLMTLLAAWCAMRFGELTELRRGDIDMKRGVVKIRRAVVRVNGEMIVGTPKSDAGTRDVAIPPHLMPLVEAHLSEHADPGKSGLLFPAASGGHMAPSTLYKVWYPARRAAGRDDLRWHDLRHTGAVLAAQTGATLAELMGRLGHSTPGAALRYQHAARDRDREIAKALSAMADARN
jgi:integrase